MELTNTKKKVIIAFVAVIVAIGIILAVYNPGDADAAEDVVKENVKIATSPNYKWTPPTYEGCANLQEWFDTLKNRRAEYEGLSNRLQEEYKDFITEEQILELDELEQACIKSSTLCRLDENDIKINEIETVLQEEKEAYETEQARIAAEQAVAEAAARAASSQSYSYSYSSGDSGNYSGSYSAFMRDGVVYHNGNKYTYYSQSVLPGGGLNIPGRHVDDGFVKDADGYICIANSAPNGTVVDTPWGAGKVYDKGTSGNHMDVYVQ